MKHIVKTAAIFVTTIGAATACVALGWKIRSPNPLVENNKFAESRSAELSTPGCQQSSDVLATLNSITEPVRRAAIAPDRYWQPGLGRTYDSVATLISAQGDARELLLREFGQGAMQMAATSEIFRPLDGRLPFLNTEEQFKVALLETEFLYSNSDSDSAKPADYLQFEIALENAIGVDMAFEYSLREAPLALELRASGVKFAETEFRGTFQILNRFNAGSINTNDYLASRKELLDLLGSQRTTRIWSHRDPRFKRLNDTAKHFNLSEEQLMSAYALLSEQQDALLTSASARNFISRSESLAASSAATSAEHAAELGTIFEQYRSRLAELIGDADIAETLQKIFLARLESEI